MIMFINFPCPTCGAGPGHLCKNENLEDQVDQVHLSRILFATNVADNLEIHYLDRLANFVKNEVYN